MTIGLHYYRSHPPNFGDELNSLVWRHLIPELDTTPRNGVLVGIGTILDRHIPQECEIFVLGSGAGLAPLPPDLRSARFQIAAVRGPLTAALAGLPAELAVTDSALLLRAIYPQLLNARKRIGGKTVFVPHLTTARNRGWQRACALAGVEFIDPAAGCIATLKKIASARLVIAEAMHAAIVADAFRVPWTPVASTRHFSTFKWVDWALSLQVPFRPTLLPAVSTRHAVQRAWLSLFAEHCLFEDVSIDGTPEDSRSAAVVELVREIRRRREAPESGARLWLRMKATAIHKRLLDPLFAWLAPSVLRPLDKRKEQRMGRLLSDLAAEPGYLSSEALSAARLRTLLEKVEWLRGQLPGRHHITKATHRGATLHRS